MSGGADTGDFGKWVESILHGDSSAFGRFYDAYTLRLFHLCVMLTRGNEDAAREVHQITMIKAARRFRRFGNETELWPWLAQIARNTYIDQVRKEGFLARLRALFVRSGQEQHQSADEETAYECLERALRALPPQDAALVELTYFEKKSQKEMAVELDRTPKAIERRLARIREDLRVALLKELKNE